MSRCNRLHNQRINNLTFEHLPIAETLTIPKTQSIYTHDELVDEKIIKWFFGAALTFPTTSMLAGLLVYLQLIRHNPFAGIELFSPADGEWFTPTRWPMASWPTASLDACTGRFLD
ncbi:MAG: hypothetical protein U0936_10895 [Planctomycetaceae bacterium]